MRKFSILFSILIVAIVLGGCGTNVSKEDVVNGAMKTDYSSFNMEAKFQMDISANGQNMEQSFDMDMTYVEEPFLAHLKMGTVDGDIELYVDKETTYIAQPGIEEWLKAPTNSVPEFAEMANGDSMKEDLERLQEFTDVFKLEKSEKGYNLSVKLTEKSSEEEMALVKDVMKESMEEDMELDDFKVKLFDYKLTFDENFYLTEAVVKADLEITSEGETANITISTDVNYTEINNIKNYSVPDDIINNAMDAEF